MADKRMFSKVITESDAFLDMPLSTQALYFHLAMQGDDDGFISSPNKTMRMIGAQKNEYDLLIAKNFIIEFEDGIVVIKHWLMHNYIRKDRYKPTAYLKERDALFIKENKAYTLDNKQGLPLGIPLVDVDKSSIDKIRLDESSIISETTTNLFKFYEKEIGMASPTILIDINDWLKHFDEEIIKEAITRASMANARNYNYIKTVLTNWLNEGVTCLGDTQKGKHKKNKVQKVESEGVYID